MKKDVVRFAPGKIAALAKSMAGLDGLMDIPQDMPQVDMFAPGIYARVLKMPAGTVIISKIHKTEHFCVVLEGRATVVREDGTQEEIIAPRLLRTMPGTQRALYIHTDSTWVAFHPTDKHTVEDIEPDIIAEDWSDHVLLEYAAKKSITHDEE